jgi:hypothetical protein
MPGQRECVEMQFLQSAKTLEPVSNPEG